MPATKPTATTAKATPSMSIICSTPKGEGSRPGVGVGDVDGVGEGLAEGVGVGMGVGVGVGEGVGVGVGVARVMVSE